MVVDEFTGSGKTIISRAKEIITNRPNIEEVHFCLLAGMSSTLDFIRDNFHSDQRIKIYCHYTLRKGLDDYYEGNVLKEKTSRMLNMESRLAKSVYTKELSEYSLGYGNAQSLIAFGKYNIPNSVFPIFWWPENNRNKRKTLFIRDVSFD